MTKSYVLMGSLLGAGLVKGLLAGPAQEKPDATQDNPIVTPQPQSGAETVGQTDPQSLSADQRFLCDLYDANLFDIAFARLVIDKSSHHVPGASGKADNGNTNELASMLVDHRTKANQEIQQLSQNSKLDLGKGMSEWRQELIQRLSQLPADELVRCFVFEEVGCHHTSVLKLRYEAAHAQDANVKTLVMRLLPEMRADLKQSSQIARQYSGVDKEDLSTAER